MPDAIFLSRLQFAATTLFHILWPLITIGLSIFLVAVEALWLRTGNEGWYRQARFWGRLFFLNVAVGVVSGIPLEFQFGTNWGAFSAAGGDFFGHMLGFEAAMAFMLEAAFIGVMMFGWKRVSPRMHFLATCMVALGGSLSAFWIMVANSWIHTPTGGYFERGRFVLTSHLRAIFNPDMFWAVPHMWVACLETSLFLIGAVSAWCLLKKRHTDFFLTSFKLALAAAVIITPLQVWLGDGSGKAVYQYQPSKLAGIESHWRTNRPGEGAPWSVVAWPDEEREENVWSLEIPDVLSFMVTGSLTGKVTGLRDIPRENRPPILLIYYCFRIMVAAGFALLLLALWTLLAWRKGKLAADRVGNQGKLLWAWILAAPLAYLAVETGWITREVGRQPWIIYGLLRTSDGASSIPAGMVGLSMLLFSLVYAVLFLILLAFGRAIILRGPDPPGSADHPAGKEA